MIEVRGGTVGAFANGSVKYRDNRSYYTEDPGYEWNQGLSLYKYTSLLPEMLGWTVVKQCWTFGEQPELAGNGGGQSSLPKRLLQLKIIILN